MSMIGLRAEEPMTATADGLCAPEEHGHYGWDELVALDGAVRERVWVALVCALPGSAPHWGGVLYPEADADFASLNAALQETRVMLRLCEAEADGARSAVLGRFTPPHYRRGALVGRASVAVTGIGGPPFPYPLARGREARRATTAAGEQ
jgi:hypothetical protein